MPGRPAILSRALGTLLLLGASAVVSAQEPGDRSNYGTVIASVGGVDITGVDIAIITEKTFDQLAQLTEDQRSEYLVQTAIDMNLMALAARDLGLEKSPLFERRVAFEEARLLQEAYLQHIAAEAVTADSVQAAYEEYTAKFVPEKQRRFSHILFGSEDDAKAALERVKLGENFDTVGREVSIDPAGKQSLDLGFLTDGEMVEPLNDAGFRLAKTGDMTQPISTQFGWHVLRFEEEGMSTPESLDVIQDDLKDDLVASALRTAMAELSTRYGVQMLEPVADANTKAN